MTHACLDSWKDKQRYGPQWLVIRLFTPTVLESFKKPGVAVFGGVEDLGNKG
jgi:hypothetical protein